MWGKQASRSQIRIKEIRDDVLVLSGNKYRIVLETSSINLELKSEEEQDQIAEAYGRFLNSLGFGIQIVVRTRAIDIDQYLLGLQAKANDQIKTEELVKYVGFVKSLISGSKILTRKFYVVIPYTPKKDELDSFDYVKEQLALSKNLVTRGLGRLGIKVRQLGGLEVANLFYSFYNTDTYKIQKLADWVLEAKEI